MSIKYNGTTLSAIKYNGTNLTKVIYNGTTVWEAAERRIFDVSLVPYRDRVDDNSRAIRFQITQNNYQSGHQYAGGGLVLYCSFNGQKYPICVFPFAAGNTKINTVKESYFISFPFEEFLSCPMWIQESDQNGTELPTLSQFLIDGVGYEHFLIGGYNKYCTAHQTYIKPGNGTSLIVEQMIFPSAPIYHFVDFDYEVSDWWTIDSTNPAHSGGIFEVDEYGVTAKKLRIANGLDYSSYAGFFVIFGYDYEEEEESTTTTTD